MKDKPDYSALKLYTEWGGKKLPLSVSPDAHVSSLCARVALRTPITIVYDPDSASELAGKLKYRLLKKGFWNVNLEAQRGNDHER